AGAEVTTRLFGSFLTWLQEKDSPVFVVATANNIDKLPSELLRKGRFDEIFYVGLPQETERQKIFEIHIGKRRKGDLSEIKKSMSALVAKTEGYSGADIEGVVRESIELAFTSGKGHLVAEDILSVINNTHSLSEIMKDSINKMQKEYESRKFKNASKG
ncbi:MAG: AAA family ATPase, partial [Firmicutes bacterium]|nr:AAA family ATPase [Bacillota bacterium]